MAEFKVIEIIDCITIKTLPSWHWKNRDGKELTGDTIRVLGYNSPTTENEKSASKKKLESLLLNKYVVLKNPVEILDNNMANIGCNVFLNDVDIANYFPEFSSK